MASQAQRGDRYGPREKLGAFSRIVRSVTFMSQEQKIAFDNSVKGDPREERNIPWLLYTSQSPVNQMCGFMCRALAWLAAFARCGVTLDIAFWR